MLKHIALEITESDIQDFYVAILGARIKNQFLLNEEDAEQIFNIRKSADVYYLSLDQVEFELFIHTNLPGDTFNHTCLTIANARKVFELANARGFWTHLRKSGDNETYFIKDKNGNLFELKNKIPYNEQFIG